MGELKENRPGNFEYVDDDGSVLGIERAHPPSREGYVAFRVNGDFPYVWVHPDDIRKVIDAILVAGKPKCQECNGKGHL